MSLRSDAVTNYWALAPFQLLFLVHGCEPSPCAWVWVYDSWFACGWGQGEGSTAGDNECCCQRQRSDALCSCSVALLASSHLGHGKSGHFWICLKLPFSSRLWLSSLTYVFAASPVLATQASSLLAKGGGIKTQSPAGWLEGAQHIWTYLSLSLLALLAMVARLLECARSNFECLLE